MTRRHGHSITGCCGGAHLITIRVCTGLISAGRANPGIAGWHARGAWMVALDDVRS